MAKKSFKLRNVAKIGVTCLAVCMIFVACGKKDKDGNEGEGKWPSASVLSKYGLDGMQKPAGLKSSFFVENGGIQLIITIGGNASTAASIKSYFSGGGWVITGESPQGEYTSTTYGKEVGNTVYAVVFLEEPDYCFQITAVKAPK